MAMMRGGPEYIGWGSSRYQTAELIDAVRENTWAFVCANTKRAPKRPTPTWRPAAKKKTNLFAAMARQAYNSKKRNT